MQKNEFLNGEGDAYFARNRCNYQAENDPLIGILDDIDLIEKRALRVLEIGCGKGERLAHLKTSKSWVVHGLDPSQKAIDHARSIGVDGVTGTADKLPWPDEQFDLVVFGFCLYLCDLSDLFTIAKECNRVLSSSGWIVIVDFFAKDFRTNLYKHKPGIISHKLDFSRMFDWHPHYHRFEQKIIHHSTGKFTDNLEEWVGIHTLRKNSLNRPIYSEFNL